MPGVSKLPNFNLFPRPQIELLRSTDLEKIGNMQKRLEANSSCLKRPLHPCPRIPGVSASPSVYCLSSISSSQHKQQLITNRTTTPAPHHHGQNPEYNRQLPTTIDNSPLQSTKNVHVHTALWVNRGGVPDGNIRTLKCLKNVRVFRRREKGRSPQ